MVNNNRNEEIPYVRFRSTRLSDVRPAPLHRTAMARAVHAAAVAEETPHTGAATVRAAPVALAITLEDLRAMARLLRENRVPPIARRGEPYYLLDMQTGRILVPADA